MNLRPLLRPPPLLLIFVFVAVAVVDLVHHFRHPPEPLPELLRGGGLRFEAWEPVVDLRPREEEAIAQLPVPQLVGGGWSARESRGAWILGPRAELGLLMARGGHRTLVLECLPAQGGRPVRSVEVRINGTSCGSLELARGWGRYRLALAEGTVRPGANRLAFVLPDRAGGNGPGRALLLRRLALFLGEDIDVDSIDRRAPVSLDLEKDAVTIRASGRLAVPITLDGRVDSLRLRCRFTGSGGRCEVVVARPQGTGIGRDSAIRRVIDSRQAGSGDVRVPVHGRRGDFLLGIDAHLNPGPGRLVIISPRLVRETGPAANPRGKDRRRQ